MKKNHKREILIARVTFAAFLVVVALIVALIVVLVSSHIRKSNEADNKQPQAPVTKQEEPTEKIPDIQPATEGIIEEETQQEEPQEETQSKSRWTTDSVRFRVEPNTDCDVITGLSKGTEVEYISEDNGWTKVQFNGKTGYISSEYLTSTEP